MNFEQGVCYITDHLAADFLSLQHGMCIFEECCLVTFLSPIWVVVPKKKKTGVVTAAELHWDVCCFN